MNDVGDHADADLDKSRDGSNDMLGVVFELAMAMSDRAARLNRTLGGTSGNLEEMQKMMEYQGAGAMDKVLSGIANSTVETGALVNIMNAVQRRTNEYRDRMGNVFSSMGVTLDLNSIEDMANSTIAHEESLRERL